MNMNKLKSAFLAASTIAVALSVGFAAPASAVPTTLVADKTVVRNGESVNFTTNAPGENYAAFFTNGEYWGSGSIETTPNPFTWDLVGPCASVDVTFRIYNYAAETADESDATLAALYDQPYAATVDVRFAGDTTVDCDDAYGAGKSADALANTGSDASTVAGMTGIAGVTALAVAVAVARRTRRAQR